CNTTCALPMKSRSYSLSAQRTSRKSRSSRWNIHSKPIRCCNAMQATIKSPTTISCITSTKSGCRMQTNTSNKFKPRHDRKGEWIMANYFRITAYHPAKNICAVFDSNRRFEKLWQFSAYLVQKGFKIVEVGNAEKFSDGD